MALTKTYDGVNPTPISTTGTPDVVLKTIYKIDDFLNLIPMNKKKEMMISTHPDIIILVKGLSTLLRELNLNLINPSDEDDWVYKGFAAMVTEGIFLQNVVETFLEL